MNKLKKTISVILCATLASGILSGCGDVDKEKYVAKSRSEADENISIEENPEEISNDTPETAPVEKITSDGAWMSMAFNLNGTDMVFSKLPYSTLRSEDWSFNPELYGFDGIVAAPGSYYQRSIYLEHENYDDGTIMVGFANFNEQDATLDELQLWSIEFLTKDKTNYPQVTLEGGITWGSDEAAIKEAYGEPSSSERNDAEGYTELVYTDNAGKSVYLDLYDGTGVGRIVIESYV